MPPSSGWFDVWQKPTQFFFFFFFFYFIFKFYIIVLVLPNIKMNPLQVYMYSPSWTETNTILKAIIFHIKKLINLKFEKRQSRCTGPLRKQLLQSEAVEGWQSGWLIHHSTESNLSRTCKRDEELSQKVTANTHQPSVFSVEGHFTYNDSS